MKTYNVPDCTCNLDHDSLEHIIAAVLGNPAVQFLSLEDVSETIANAAKDVGWVKLSEEDLSKLAGLE